jgi:hypothetical protein
MWMRQALWSFIISLDTHTHRMGCASLTIPREVAAEKKGNKYGRDTSQVLWELRQ